MKRGHLMLRNWFLFTALLVLSVGCRPKTEPTATSSPEAGPSAAASALARPALPAEPAPPLTEKAGEVPDLEAKLATDKAYAAVWTGPRADLNAFLSYVGELVATGGAPKPLADAVRAKKLGDAGIKLFLVFSRVGKFPDDFTGKLASHLEATKSEPHLGTWTAFTKGGAYHDYTALAAWSRRDDPAYLREHLAAKADAAGPFPWSPWMDKEPPARPWLVDEGAALDRLALTTTLTPAEESRRAALAAVAKKEAAAKAEMTGAVQVTAAALFHAYEANEVSADEQYKGKKLLVTGTVASIDKGGITGEAILLKLTTPNQFLSVTASMEDEEKPKTMKLAKGDAVKVLCTGGAMKVIGFIQISDCTLR